MSRHDVPSRSELRQLLEEKFPTASELEAFCLDHFPSVKARFSTGMDRVAMVNLLLESIQPAELWPALHPTAAKPEEPFDELDQLYFQKAERLQERKDTTDLDAQIAAIKRR